VKIRPGKTLAALAVTAVAWVAPVPGGELRVFFGTYTNALSQGIYASRLEETTGKLSAPELAVTTPSPCFLAVSPNKKFLYAANSIGSFQGQKGGAVSAFAINQNSLRLTLLNQKSSGGVGPCHVGVDALGKVLLVANYGGGSVKSLVLASDGFLGADGTIIQHHGASVNPSRQTGPHAHFIAADPSNRFALACDLGLDKVMIDEIRLASGTLVEHGLAAVPPGSGARHLAFSPDGRFAYVINEMACTVTTFAWNAEAGKLELVETVSALPPGVAARSDFTAAEILTSGHFIYATIRGPDCVNVLAADPRTGRLSFLQSVSSGGKVPRGLGIDPAGRWLLVGNQGTDNVVEFAVDPATGKLSATGQELRIGSPVDVKFVR
jgi:6-phosphogluconolactonase